MTFEDAYEILLEIGLQYKFDPSIPMETEVFLRELISSYSGPPETFPQWMDSQASQYYRCINKQPEWIQNPEWPISQGRPMVFVGQLDVHLNDGAEISFYVFWDPRNGESSLISQCD